MARVMCCPASACQGLSPPTLLTMFLKCWGGGWGAPSYLGTNTATDQKETQVEVEAVLFS